MGSLVQDSSDMATRKDMAMGVRKVRGGVRLPTLMVGLASLVITLAAFAILRNSEQSAKERRFENRAKLLAAALVREADVQVANLNSLADYFYASTEVTREEFRIFTHQRVQQEAGTEAVWWVPRVAREDRKAFEAAARNEGLTDFSIDSTEQTEAPPAEAFFPIWYIEPLEMQDALLGHDLWTNPTDRAAMMRAQETASPVVTAPLSVGGDESGMAFHVFVPVFSKVDLDSGAGDGELRGFAGARLITKEFMRDALEANSLDGICVTLLDNATGSKLAHYPHSDGQLAEVAEAPRQEQQILVGGRPWRVVCTLTVDESTHSPLARSWLLLAAGLVISGLAISYSVALHTNLRQSRLLAAAENRAKRDLEESLREREKAASAQRLLAAIVEYSGDGIIALDWDGNIISWNQGAQQIYGWKTSEILGKPLGTLLPEAVHDEHYDLLAWALNGNAISHHETEHIRSNGEAVWVSISLSPLRTDRASQNGISMLVRNETALKRAREAQRRLEQEMQEAQKMESLGVLAGGVAHDFNNLLTGIVGNAELLLGEAENGSQTQQEAQEILNAALRAADLARQMLAYTGKGRYIVEEIDLNSLILEMASLLEASVSKKTRFNYDLAADLPTVRADATQVRQVVMNLIVNASEAMAETGGAITLHTYLEPNAVIRTAGTIFEETLASGTHVCIQVSDAGTGMSDETVEHIFEPFFTTKFTGRGLGLSAVQGIMRGHGGAILVESAPGEGTRFDVFFPVAPEPRNGGPWRSSSPWIGSGTVLLADDEEAVRTVTTRMLERIGFEVLAAENGAEAVQIVREMSTPIRVVLLDLKMPVLDGIAALREIRALAPDLPVVLSSGYSAEEAHEYTAGTHYNTYLQKPYALGLLRQILQEILGEESNEPMA